MNGLDPVVVRARFPALARTHNGAPVAYLDGPGGSQVVDTAIAAMTRYLSGGVANLHGAFATSLETDRLVFEARSGAAALLGAPALAQQAEQLRFERETLAGAPTLSPQPVKAGAKVERPAAQTENVMRPYAVSAQPSAHRLVTLDGLPGLLQKLAALEVGMAVYEEGLC